MNRGRWYEAVILDMVFADTFEQAGPMARAEGELWLRRFGEGRPWIDGRRVVQAQMLYLGGPHLIPDVARGPVQ